MYTDHFTLSFGCVLPQSSSHSPITGANLPTSLCSQDKYQPCHTGLSKQDSATRPPLTVTACLLCILCSTQIKKSVFLTYIFCHIAAFEITVNYLSILQAYFFVKVAWKLYVKCTGILWNSTAGLSFSHTSLYVLLTVHMCYNKC